MGWSFYARWSWDGLTMLASARGECFFCMLDYGRTLETGVFIALKDSRRPSASRLEVYIYLIRLAAQRL